MGMGLGMEMVVMEMGEKVWGWRGIYLGYYLWVCWDGLFIVLVCKLGRIGGWVQMVRMASEEAGVVVVEGRDLVEDQEEDRVEGIGMGMSRRRRILDTATSRVDVNNQFPDSNNKDGDRGFGRE